MMLSHGNINKSSLSRRKIGIKKSELTTEILLLLKKYEDLVWKYSIAEECEDKEGTGKYKGFCYIYKDLKKLTNKALEKCNKKHN